VLDFIYDLEEKRGNRVLSDLREYVPASEPRDWVRANFSWALRDTKDILEFRWPTRGGGTPRVLWFYDTDRVVVCTHGLNKKSNAVSKEEIDTAEAMRQRYLNSKRSNTLEIVDFDDFDECDDDTKPG
jgi:phage-related protein